MTRSRAAILFLLFLVALVRMPEAQAQDSALSVTAKPGESRYLNADPQSTRYSPLDQFNKDNFKDLKVAWTWRADIGPAPPKLGGLVALEH